MAEQVVVDFIVNGLENIGKIRDAIGSLKRSADGANGVSAAVDRVGGSAKKSERDTLQLAQAQARLQQVLGDSAGAIQTLQTALENVDQATIQAIRAQTQLAYLQTSYANSPLISAIREQQAGFENLGDSAQAAGDNFSTAADDAARFQQAIAQAAQAQAKLNEGGGFVDGLKGIGDIAGSISNIITLLIIAQQAQEKLQTGSIGFGDAVRAVFRNSAAEVANFQEQVNNATAQTSNAQPRESLLAFIARINKEIIEASLRDQAAKNAGKNVAQGFADGVKTGTGNAAKAARDMAGKSTDAAEDELGIQSPSRVFFQIGVQTVQGWINGVRSRAGAAQAAVQSTINGATQAAFRPRTRAQDFLSQLFPNSARTQAIGAQIDGLLNSLTGLEARAVTSGAALGGLALGASALAVGFGTLAAAGLALIPVLVKLGTAGVNANAKLEQTEIGIATLIASVADLSNSEGINLKGIDALNAALPIARDQLEKLRVDGLQTALTFEQIADGFLQAVGPGLSAGLNLDQIRKTTIDLAQIIQPLTGNAAQLGQELRSIFSGDITADSQVASALQITKEQIQAAKEAGRLADFLNEKLLVASLTGARMAQTFAAATSNLQEAGGVIAQRVTAGFFATLRDRLNSVLPGIFTTAAGRVEIAPAFTGLERTATTIFDRIGERAGQAIDYIIKRAQDLSAFLDDNRADVELLIGAIDSLIGATGNLGDSILRALGSNAANALKLLVNFIRQAALSVAELQDIFELFTAAALRGLETISLAVVKGLQGALRSFGIELQGLADEALRIGNNILQLDQRLRESGKNRQSLEEQYRRQDAIAALTPEELKTLGNVFFEGSGVTPQPPKNPATVNPRPVATDKGKGKREADDAARILEALNRAIERLQEARIRFTERSVERATRATLAGIETEQQALQASYDARLIGVTEFYNRRTALAQRAGEAEAQAAQAALKADNLQLLVFERSAAKRLASAKPAERAGVQKELAAERLNLQSAIADAEARVTEAQNKLKQKLGEISAESRRTLEQLNEQLTEAGLTGLEASGQQLEAAFARIDAQYADVLAQARAQFGEFSQEVAALTNTINALKSEAVFRDAQERFRTAQTTLDASRSNIQNLFNEGLISEKAAREQILALERASRVEQEKKLVALEELISRLSDGTLKESLQAQVFQLRVELQTLGIDPLIQEIRQGLNSDIKGAFESFFTDFGRGWESVRDLALGVVNSFQRALAKIISDELDSKFIQPLVNKFFDFLGLGKVQPEQIANTAATNANTVAVNALTAAILAQSANNLASQIGDFAVQVPDDFNPILPNGAQAENPITDAINNVFDSIGNTLKKFAQDVSSVAGRIASGVGSVLGSIVSVAGNIFGAIFGSLGGAETLGGGWSVGYADGGFTAAVPATQPAGVVHGGEWVAPAWMVNSPAFAPVIGALEHVRNGGGVQGLFNRMHSRASLAMAPRVSRGYAMGGLVAEPSGATAGNAPPINIRNVTVFDPSEIENVMNSAAGERAVLNIVNRRSAAVRQMIGVSQGA